MKFKFVALAAALLVGACATQPAPAPTPAPAPAPLQRNFLVFFDLGKSALTQDGGRVVAQAAQNSRTAAATRVTVTGHADRSGKASYNVILSRKRAEAVRAALVQQGVAANQISLVARGEAQPLVPTRDGVKEPQNRRVEIVF